MLITTIITRAGSHILSSDYNASSYLEEHYGIEIIEFRNNCHVDLKHSFFRRFLSLPNMYNSHTFLDDKYGKLGKNFAH